MYCNNEIKTDRDIRLVKTYQLGNTLRFMKGFLTKA